VACWSLLLSCLLTFFDLINSVIWIYKEFYGSFESMEEVIYLYIGTHEYTCILTYGIVFIYYKLLKGGYTLKKYSFYIAEDKLEHLKGLSKKTRVPVSRYLDEAIEDLLRKYDTEEKESTKE
jgi:hypothetical protein